MDELTWTTQTRKLSDLGVWDKNPRKLSEHDETHLRRSIRKFGLADPLIVNADGQLIGGHQRRKGLSALEEFGPDAEVDVRVPSRALGEDEAAELAIRLNRNAGEWDWEALGLDFSLDDLKDWGFTDLELEVSELELAYDDEVEGFAEGNQFGDGAEIVIVTTQDKLNEVRDELFASLDKWELKYKIKTV